MAWVLLLIAGLLEIVWVYTMKLSQGFSRPGPTIVTLLAMIASFALLSVFDENVVARDGLHHLDRDRCGRSFRRGRRHSG